MLLYQILVLNNLKIIYNIFKYQLLTLYFNFIDSNRKIKLFK